MKLTNPPEHGFTSHFHHYNPFFSSLYTQKKNGMESGIMVATTLVSLNTTDSVARFNSEAELRFYLTTTPNVQVLGRFVGMKNCPSQVVCLIRSHATALEGQNARKSWSIQLEDWEHEYVTNAKLVGLRAAQEKADLHLQELTKRYEAHMTLALGAIDVGAAEHKARTLANAESIGDAVKPHLDRTPKAKAMQHSKGEIEKLFTADCQLWEDFNKPERVEGIRAERTRQLVSERGDPEWFAALNKEEQAQEAEQLALQWGWDLNKPSDAMNPRDPKHIRFKIYSRYGLIKPDEKNVI